MDLCRFSLILSDAAAAAAAAEPAEHLGGGGCVPAPLARRLCASDTHKAAGASATDKAGQGECHCSLLLLLLLSCQGERQQKFGRR